MKDQKGITLIALVITIIVMLILVAVTIVFAVNGGLFSKANDAAEETRLAQINEAIALTKADLYADYYDPTNLTAGNINGASVNGTLCTYRQERTAQTTEANAATDTAVLQRVNYYLDSNNKEARSKLVVKAGSDPFFNTSSALYTFAVKTVDDAGNNDTEYTTAKLPANADALLSKIDCGFWK